MNRLNNIKIEVETLPIPDCHLPAGDPGICLCLPYNSLFIEVIRAVDGANEDWVQDTGPPV